MAMPYERQAVTRSGRYLAARDPRVIEFLRLLQCPETVRKVTITVDFESNMVDINETRFADVNYGDSEAYTLRKEELGQFIARCTNGQPVKPVGSTWEEATRVQ